MKKSVRTLRMNHTWLCFALLLAGMLITGCWPAAGEDAGWFEGKHYRGRGDVEYLQLLDTARRMFEPDPEFQNMSMLYTPLWNGLVEGPTWNMWWIQNSYGTTYSALPFYQEPFVTFLQNSQDLWFNQMGDGRRAGCPGTPADSWVAPDGQLCDAAAPGCIIYRQGDGRTAIHDWGLEFTAAGVLMQSELLLISRDPRAIAHYLPLLSVPPIFLIPAATRKITSSWRAPPPICWPRVTRDGRARTGLTVRPTWRGSRLPTSRRWTG